MRSSLGASLAVLVLVVSPALAQAAPTPGPVTVRVEGSTATLIPPTLVATQPASYTPVGKSSPCPGTSAAEALDLATLANGTTWNGTFFSSFGDYLVASIAGEAHPTGATDGHYWAFWYDHKPAQLGVCGQPLNPNDEILFFPDCFGACPAGFVSPAVLGLTAPTVVQKGSPVGVQVTAYANADGAASPATGATVSGGGVTSAPTVNGAATLTFPSVGTFILRAEGTNDVRSEPHTICVHDGDDGNCGTAAAPGSTTTTPTTSTPPPTCTTNGRDGRCGTTDQTAPRGRLSIAEGTHYRHGHGPRVLTGRVDTDPSGLRDVLMRVTRVVTHRRCESYSAARRRFAKATCGVTHAAAFSIGNAPTFSYLMPAALSKGRYTVEVEAVDGAGNHDAASPGRNEIVFRVE
ncbi:MAG: hypothetical protein ACR2KV_06890 [Solirubrobacteraceae bacterium]